MRYASDTLICYAYEPHGCVWIVILQHYYRSLQLKSLYQVNSSDFTVITVAFQIFCSQASLRESTVI